MTLSAFRHTGRLSIDFSLTGGEGERFARFEVLHAPSDLDAWLAASPLRVAGAGSGARDLAGARRLRWAIWHAVQSGLEDVPVPAGHADVIEAAAAHAPLLPRLDGGGWRDPTARAAMSDIARDAIALLTDPTRRDRLRVCAAADCGVPFFDDSRPGRRRWCEADRCGDRHRHRQQRTRRGKETT
jgi:predicted RNA-binding Zn ribbon-like protein